ncbi:MAG TPA: UDP binding domain-containing protein, partial [Ohtaekwangia sp.]|uniref:UDP binding domain-containing protein n=1 Tax=Ohtaekwangia sp. TaxID=2066019 RepID=UPI002F95B588
LSGRRINDNMGVHIANSVIKLMAQRNLPINNANILMLGITFKENCPDIRNSRVVDVYHELKSFGTQVDVYDPQADEEEVKHEYSISLTKNLSKKYHAIILTVSHQEFAALDLQAISHEGAVIYDVKGFLPKSTITARL